MTDPDKNGRPSTYSDAIAAHICEELAGGRSLREIIRTDEGMPALSSVFKWLSEHQSFSDQYARAREVQAETLVDEILEISDDGTNDYMERTDSEGGNVSWRENGEALARSKLRVDTRKWVASKILAKKYGDKLNVEQSGTLALTGSLNLTALTDDQLALLASIPTDPAGTR